MTDEDIAQMRRGLIKAAAELIADAVEEQKLDIVQRMAELILRVTAQLKQ